MASSTDCHAQTAWVIGKSAAPLKGTWVKIRFFDGPVYRAIIKLLPEFEKATGIEVNYEIVPYQTAREKQVLNLTSKGDLTMALVGLVWIGEFAQGGWIVPIDNSSMDASITDPNLKLKGYFPLLLMQVVAVDAREIQLKHAARSGATITLPLRDGAQVRAGDAVTLGLRPEHIELGSAAPIGLTVRAEYVESLGSSSHIHAKTSDGSMLTVQVPGRLTAHRGDTLQVSAQPQHAYLFNADGRAL